MSTRSVSTEEFLNVIGARVRALRQERRWTVQYLADAASLSRRMLTQIELGQANPSLATIDRIAHALHTNFGELAVQKTSPANLGSEHTVAWEGPDGSVAFILGTADGAGAELWRWRLAPGVRYEAEPDRDGAEEIHHVLTGILFLELEKETLELSAGMTATIRSDQRYSYCAGTDAAEFIRVVAGA